MPLDESKVGSWRQEPGSLDSSAEEPRDSHVLALRGTPLHNEDAMATPGERWRPEYASSTRETCEMVGVSLP
jgi:hypothetical protein